MDSRVEFDQYLILLANVIKLRSQDPFRRVGAVGASEDHRIVATGYNGLISKFESPEDFGSNRENPNREKFFVHAETNLLNFVRRGEIHVVAISCSPCQNCAKHLASHGVKRVLYSELYHREQNFKEIFDFYKIEHELCPINFNWLDEVKKLCYTQNQSIPCQIYN